MTTDILANEILVQRAGNAGLITLNRPKALNALSLQIAYSDQPDQLFRAHPIANRSEATAEFSGGGGHGGSLAE